jgi:hypothetical protein
MSLFHIHRWHSSKADLALLGQDQLKELQHVDADELADDLGQSMRLSQSVSIGYVYQSEAPIVLLHKYLQQGWRHVHQVMASQMVQVVCR